MKFKKIDFCNRKKRLFLTYSNNKTFDVHYAELGISKNIKKVWIDKETNGKTLGIEFEDGNKDFMPYDQPLYLKKEPEYMLRLHIEHIVSDIKNMIKKKHISKAYIRDVLNTSDSQIQRLLNPSTVNKNLSQLYKIANILGLEFEFNFKKAS